MATEKVYIVLEGQKYTGKHKVYTEGQEVSESEIFGSLSRAMNGSKNAKDKRGNPVKESQPKLKLKGGGSAGRPSDKKDNK